MKSTILGSLVLLTFIAAGQSDQICEIEGNEISIPDTFDCVKYVSNRLESYRFPTFPWIRLPPILSTLLPILVSRRPTTTEAPDSDEDDDSEVCPESGVKQISHPTNCEKYILCVGGMEIERNCAPGFHFSRESRSCVDPEVAGCEVDRKWVCPEVDDLNNLTFLPNKENCAKYYLCFGGEQIPMACGDGLHWSTNKDMCLPQKEADCEFEDDDIEECPDEGVKTISHPYNCAKYILCVGGTRIKRHCAPGFHFSRELRSCVDPEIAECEDGEDDDDIEECPDSGVKSISHPDNCEKYVLCVGGNRFKRNCAPGMHFSRDFRTCVHPEIAGCEEVEENVECPAVDDLDNLIFLPNPKDCSKYYFCFGGEANSLSCGEGLHWSVDAQMCLNKAEAGCKEFDDVEECPDEGIKSISHPDNCEKFILCVGGTRIKRQCAPGLHFSREFRFCVRPELAGCEEEEEEDEIEQCPDSGIKSISHPDNCEKYVLCVGGTRIKRNCAPGLHFSREMRTCVSPNDAECEERKLSCPKVDDLDNLVFLPNKEDCSMYYVCFGGEAVPLSCSAGLHWSVEDQMCLAKEKANCDFERDDNFEECPDTGIKQISHPSSCEKYVLCISGTRINRQCAPGFHFSREFRTCVLPHMANCDMEEEGEEEAFTCPEKDDLADLIFLPSQEDCAKYYLCHGGEQVQFSCGRGLHWSRKNEMCMLKDDADCHLA